MKGIVVAGVVKYLRRWLRSQEGSPELELSPSARALLEDRGILPSSWYDYEAYLELVKLVHERTLDRSDADFAQFVAAGAPLVYRGAHRTLIVAGDPAGTLRNIKALWGTCHSFGKPRAEIGSNAAVVHFSGVAGMTPIEGIVNAAWVGGAIVEAGGQDVRYDIVDEPWEGAPDLVVAYRWS